jgi:hypothetical protein
LLPHEVEREPDRHAEHHVERRVVYAGGIVVLLAERQGYQTLHQRQPRNSERDGQRNDQNAEESRDYDEPPPSSVACAPTAEPAYIPTDRQATRLLANRPWKAA